METATITMLNTSIRKLICLSIYLYNLYRSLKIPKKIITDFSESKCKMINRPVMDINRAP